MNSEHAAALAATALFAIGAVVIIIYNHANATSRILSVVGANTGNVGLGAASDGSSWLGQSASLAGTPTIGQDGSSMTPTVQPLNIEPGFTFS